MGDDYQVVASQLLKSQLEEAGAEYTLLSSEFDAPAQARMLEDAIATKAYDAVILHPLDPGGIAATVDKAEAAGIPVYNWVTPVKTDKTTAFAGYKADTMDANGQIGAKFLELAKAAGATKENPYRVLEIWGFRSAPLCVERHNGLMMGIGDSGIVEVSRIGRHRRRAGEPDQGDPGRLRPLSRHQGHLSAVRRRQRHHRGAALGRQARPAG